MKKNKKKHLRDLTLDEKRKIATHYIENGIQPSHYVTVGYLASDGKFDSLLFSLHKQEAERIGLIKSNDPLRLLWWFS